MTNTFRTFIAPAIAATALFAGGAANAAEQFDWNNTIDYGAEVTIENDIDVEQALNPEPDPNACPAGQSRVTQKVRGGGFMGMGWKTVDYGCMTQRDYQQMLANHYAQQQRRPGYVAPAHQGGQVCTGRVSMYGAVHATCY